MNERIKELLDQSTIECMGIKQTNHKEFAELIVKECIAKYDEWAEESSDQTSFRMARHNVKKHFGVE